MGRIGGGSVRRHGMWRHFVRCPSNKSSDTWGFSEVAKSDEEEEVGLKKLLFSNAKICEHSLGTGIEIIV